MPLALRANSLQHRYALFRSTKRSMSKPRPPDKRPKLAPPKLAPPKLAPPSAQRALDPLRSAEEWYADELVEHKQFGELVVGPNSAWLTYYAAGCLGAQRAEDAVQE